MTKKPILFVKLANIHHDRYVYLAIVSLKVSTLLTIVDFQDIHGCEKTLLSLERFFYWPGMYKWVGTLTMSCLICRKNKQIRKDQNTAPNEKWGEQIPYPFHTVHIDHKGPLNSMSDGKHHCLVVIDEFSRCIQVYPVKSTDASFAIDAMTSFFTFILSKNWCMMEVDHL